MNLVEQSPLKPSGDLDGLLRTFFRSQMPHPWPAPRLPHFRATPATRAMPPRRPLIRSRWALAASISLLLLGSLLLPGRLTPNAQPGSDPARRWDAFDFERQRMKEEQKMKEFREKHNMLPDVKDDGRVNGLDDSDLSSLK
jgi:hypothetical protein